MIMVKYIEKGREHDFKRVDRERNIVAINYFINGGLYYFRINRFSYVTIAKEDVLEMKEGIL